MKGKNSEDVKFENGQNIRNLIYREGPISRIEISARLGLTPPTITTYVSSLLASGLVREFSPVLGKESDSAMGRRRVSLEFVKDAAYAVGVDMGPYATYFVLTDLKGNIIVKKEATIASTVYDEALDFVASKVKELIAESGISPQKILGMGVGLAGYVDHKGKILRFGATNKWIDVPIADDLTSRTGLGCVVKNNARARSVSVELFSEIRLKGIYAYLLVAKGIACPIIIGSDSLYPSHVTPGEIGHMVLDRFGEKCQVCGNRGCLDTLSSENAIVLRCRELLKTGEETLLRGLVKEPDELTISDVMYAQKRGDRAVERIMCEAMRYLGVSVANLINLINPPLVLVDSYMMENIINRDYLVEYASKNLYAINKREIEIKFVPFEKYRTAIGVAGVVIKDFLLRDGKLNG